MKKLALGLALILLVLPLGGCKNLEAGLFYDRMNEHREFFFSQETRNETHWTITGDGYFFERVGENTLQERFYGDRYEYRKEVDVVDDGVPKRYTTYGDGDFSYTHFHGSGEKMKVRDVNMDALVKRIEQKYSDDAVTKVFVTQEENGWKRLTVEFDLTLVEAELREKARETALNMARFDSELRYTWAKVEYLVDENYLLQEEWYHELLDITEPDGTLLVSELTRHTTYLSYDKIQRVNRLENLEDYKERV